MKNNNNLLKERINITPLKSEKKRKVKIAKIVGLMVKIKIKIKQKKMMKIIIKKIY